MDTHAAEQKESDKRPSPRSRLWTRTGFGDKTLYDFLQLLVVPLALAVIGFWFTAQQDARQQQIANQRAASERQIEEQRAQDAALQAHLDQMSTLLLEKDLRDSEAGSEVRTLARARTLTVLRRLDGARKGSVVQFLAESGLINKDRSVLDLTGADLHEAILNDADLSGADLSNAYLKGATVTEEQLEQASSLEGATMPDGQKYENWLKDKEGRRKDGENGGPS